MREWVANLFGIGSVTLADDDGELQRLQVTERAAGRGIGDRISDRVRRITEFGFTSVPPLDSEALLARRGGERSQSMVIGTSHRPSRPRGLKPGDSCLYDVRGARVQLTADGLLVDCAGLPAIVRNATTVTIQASEKVRMETPLVEVTGNLHVMGSSALDGDVAAGQDMTVAATLGVTGAVTAASTLDVAGKIAGGGLVSAGGDVEARAGGVSLNALRDAYAAHGHGGVKSGSDTSAGPNKTA